MGDEVRRGLGVLAVATAVALVGLGGVTMSDGGVADFSKVLLLLGGVVAVVALGVVGKAFVARPPD